MSTTQAESKYQEALTEFNKSKFTAAVEKCRQVIEFEPTDIKTYQLWSEAAASLKDSASALAELEKNVEEKHDTAETREVLGHTYLKVLNYDKALESFIKAIEHDPTNVNCIINAGHSATKLEKHQKAIEFYKQASELEPQNITNLYNWSYSELKLKQYENVIELSKRIVAVKVDALDAYMNWADSLQHLKDVETNLSQYKDALSKIPDQATRHYLLGSALKQLNRINDAIVEFRNTVDLDDHRYDAYIDLGNLLLDKKEYDAAMECYDRARQSVVYAHIAQNNLGLVCIRKGKPRDSIAHFEQAVKQNPTFKLAYTNWIDALENLEDQNAQLQKFKAALTNLEDRVEKQELLALAYRKLKRYADAVSEYQIILDKIPEDFVTLINIGNTWLDDGKYDAAIKNYQQAASVRPESAIPIYNLGLALERANKFDEAIKQYKKAASLDKAGLDIYTNWLGIIAKTHSPDDELKEFKQEISNLTDKAKRHYLLGRAYKNLRRTEEAIVEFKQALTGDDHYDSLVYLGNIYFDRSDFEAAIEQYKKAAIIKSAAAIPQFNWGLAMERQGKYIDAIEHYKTAVSLDGSDMLAYRHWSLLLSRMENADVYLEEFRYAIVKNLDTAEGYKLLGETLYYDFRKLEDAITAYQMAISKNKKFSDAYFNLGNILWDMYRYGEAIEHYQKAIDIERYSYYLHNRASILQKMGRYRESKQWWCEALDVYPNYVPGIEERNISYYIYWGSIYQEVFRDLASAEIQYQKAREIDPSSYVPYLSLAKLYVDMKESVFEFQLDNEHSRDINKFTRLFARKKTSISETEKGKDINSSVIESTDSGLKRNEASFKAWEAYRQVEKLLLKQLSANQTAELQNDLADLYIKFGKYSEAEDILLKILAQNSQDLKAIKGMGVILTADKKFKRAVEYFSKALSIDQDDLDVRFRLANAQFRHGNRTDAERGFQYVLDVAPYHIDACLGMAELYVCTGEDAEKAGKKNDAVMYFNDAKKLYQRTLEYANYTEHSGFEHESKHNLTPCSRLLDMNELSSIYYSLGYVQTRCSEVNKSEETQLLNQAKSNFDRVPQGARDYYKARRAYEKLDDYLNSLKKTNSIIGGRIVLSFAVLVFFITQLSFLIGRPLFGYTDIEIHPEEVATLFKELKIEVKQLPDELKKLNTKHITTSKQLLEELRKTAGTDGIQEAQIIPLIKKGGTYGFIGYEKMSEGFYILLTFGSMIFLIAGLFLKELTKLKVGAVELEKASVGQVAVTTSLNIQR